MIEDLSCNGTFINSSKLGQGNKKLLLNNDEVALTSPNTKGMGLTCSVVSNVTLRYHVLSDTIG